MRTPLIAAALLLAASSAAPALAQEAPEGGAWTACRLAEIAAYQDRFEFVCEAASKDVAGAGPSVFSLERRDLAADAALSLAIEAKRAGRPLLVLYVKSAQANPNNCPEETCRRLVAVRLR